MSRTPQTDAAVAEFLKRLGPAAKTIDQLAVAAGDEKAPGCLAEDLERPPAPPGPFGEGRGAGLAHAFVPERRIGKHQIEIGPALLFRQLGAVGLLEGKAGGEPCPCGVFSGSLDEFGDEFESKASEPGVEEEQANERGSCACSKLACQMAGGAFRLQGRGKLALAQRVFQGVRSLVLEFALGEAGEQKGVQGKAHGPLGLDEPCGKGLGLRHGPAPRAAGCPS